MIYDTDFPKPVPSFPFPVALVTTEPDSEPYVCIKFNRDWLPYVLGSLAQLLLMATWNAATQDELNEQLQRANGLIYLFQRGISCECPTPSTGAFVNDMLFFRQVCENNVCYLEFECCPGEWVRLGRADQIPAGSQPGNGSQQPSPGGGTADYCATLQANNKLYIPTVLNSGDVVTIQASGAGNDGGHTEWYCPDGSQFFAGACTGYSTTDGGDPLPSTSHMALIINVGGTFYPFASNSFTVPSGISNAQAYIQCNDSDITNNAGSYQVCVTVTNNQAGSWSHTFDLTLSPSGWNVSNISACDPTNQICSWVSGVGFVGTGFTPTATRCIIDRTVSLASGSHITSVTAYVHQDAGVAACNGIFYTDCSGWSCPIIALPGDQTIVDTSTVTPTHIWISNQSGTNTTIRTMKVVITGTGVDPF